MKKTHQNMTNLDLKKDVDTKEPQFDLILLLSLDKEQNIFSTWLSFAFYRPVSALPQLSSKGESLASDLKRFRAGLGGGAGVL